MPLLRRDPQRRGAGAARPVHVNAEPAERLDHRPRLARKRGGVEGGPPVPVRPVHVRIRKALVFDKYSTGVRPVFDQCLIIIRPARRVVDQKDE